MVLGHGEIASMPAQVEFSVTNKSIAGNHCSTTPSSRPTSSHTLHSAFADSAVDMDATTPTETVDSQTKSEPDYFRPDSPPATPPIDLTLSDKMRQLTAIAWTLEQDDTMTSKRRDTLKSMLVNIETYLEAAPEEPSRPVTGQRQSKEEVPPLAQEKAANMELGDQEDGEEDEWIDESELVAVRHQLALTVREMKMRQEEQRHLHQLMIDKLEAVAQRCLAHEQQADDLQREIRELRFENNALGKENDQLREKLTYIEEEAAHKDVAVHAMSSAVAGLEGWIESTHASRPQTPVVQKKPKRQRVVIRGKGRFRGRYYVDEDGDHAVAYSLADAAAENQELHDGVKAWLRGFRDVEEELRHHESPSRARSQGRFRSHTPYDEDEWGEFQSPGSLR